MAPLGPYEGWRSFAEYELWGMRRLVALGWSPEQAAAIIGNLVQESGLNPNALAVGDAGPGEDSEGIGQWNRTRRMEMHDFVVRVAGHPYGVLGDQEKFEGQIGFVDHEVRSAAYAPAMRILRESPPGDQSLAGRFGKVYEGFRDSSGADAHKRDAFAALALARYRLAEQRA